MDPGNQSITLEQFLSWKIEALREYFGRRGLAKDKPKNELAALAYSAHVMKIPPLPSSQEQEEVRKRDYQSLLHIDSVMIPDPFTLHSRWMDERQGMKQWPPIYLGDIVEYAGGSDSNVSIAKFLQEYKLGKGQSFIDSNHLGKIFYHPITRTSNYCILRSLCTPSQHLKDDPHKIWICAEKETGSIKSSYCTCTAGLASPSVHITAVLFRIETAHRLGASSCTFLPCTWTVPSALSKSTKAEPSKLKELKVVKPVHSLITGGKRQLVSVEKSNFQPIPRVDDGIFKELTDVLRHSLPNARVFKGIDIPEVVEAIPAGSSNQFSVNEYLMAEMVTRGLEGPVEEPLCRDVADSINTATKGQHTNKNWHAIRRGRITSSIFHSVHCKILHNRDESVVQPLVSNIMGYTSLNPNIKSLKYRREMEPTAKRLFYVHEEWSQECCV